MTKRTTFRKPLLRNINASKPIIGAASLILIGGLVPLSAIAQTVDVQITNLTQGIYFTPLLVKAHDSDSHVFQAGESASIALQAMAEGGDIGGLVAEASSSEVLSENPAGGLLAPGASAMVSDLDTGANGNLSLVAMILPSNDGFIGLDSWTIPEEAGTYTVSINAYDAGTEVNDEIINGGGAPGVAGIPANPGGNGGTGASGVTTEEPNTMIHIHRGNIGDTDAAGGVSDVDSRIHRWLNPVARITVTVK